MRFIFVKISIILILILLESRYGWCFDTFPDESQSVKPPTIEDGLKSLPPLFINKLAKLLHMNTTRKSEMDLVRGIIAKAQEPSTRPSAMPSSAPSVTSDMWSYPSALESLRSIFGTTTNLSRSDLCEMLMGDFKADIIIVPAIRADEISFIGGAVANFIGSKGGHRGNNGFLGLKWGASHLAGSQYGLLYDKSEEEKYVKAEHPRFGTFLSICYNQTSPSPSINASTIWM